MSNGYKDKAIKLRLKYDAEVELLNDKWFGDLQKARGGDPSPEGRMPSSWRGGWMEYLQLVVRIGEEKMAKLQEIANAKTTAAAKPLVQKLSADYLAEAEHYDLLVGNSQPSGPPDSPGESAKKYLSDLLKREAKDRREYVAELNSVPVVEAESGGSKVE